MKTHVQKWGNSLAVRIPKAFAVDLEIDQDASVDLTVEDGALILRPLPTAGYHLSDLLAKVTEDNLHPVVEWGAPLGREEW